MSENIQTQAIDEPQESAQKPASDLPIAVSTPEGAKLAEKGDIKPAFAQNDPIMSKWEKVFDKTVYTGLNYWTNLIISVAMADKFLTKGTSWNKFMESAIEKTTLAVHGMGVDITTAHSKSRSGLKFLSLLSGGYALLIPLKYLEDNKRNVVYWLNDKFGVPQIAPDGRKLTPEEIHIEEEQPKQSWGNVIMRRLYGTGAVIGSGLALTHFYRDKENILKDEIVQIGEHTITHKGKPLGGDERLTGQITGFLNKGLKHLPFGFGEKVTNIGGTPNRWINLLALDTFFTVITAVVMFVTRGAAKAKMPNEIDNSGDPPSHEIKHHIVQDAVVMEEKPTNHAGKVGKKEDRKIEKKSIVPEELLAAKHGDSAPAFAM